jgi:type III secretory pathway component EscT
VKRIVGWLFASPKSPRPWNVLVWWEARRLPFNLIVGAYAGVCFAVFAWAITTSGHFQRGEDVVEPILLIAAPFAINALYTLGWLLELSVQCVAPSLSTRFGPTLLKVGLVLGLFLITLPAGLWAGYRFLQPAGLVA